MITVTDIANWVETKPLILISFDEKRSASLRESRRGLNHLTDARDHDVFRNFKLPTLCLLELHDLESTECYVGCVIRKQAVTTFQTMITVKMLREINPHSFQEIGSRILEERHKRSFAEKSTVEKLPSVLSPKLSSYLIHTLAEDPNNKRAMTFVATHLPDLGLTLHNNRQTQRDAIHLALKIFGLSKNETTEDITLTTRDSSELSIVGEGDYLYEDSVINYDASELPGFKQIEKDVTGRAIFENNRGEMMVIYTANRLPLEEMLGVDLIYINRTKGNIVMIQYKMLEQEKSGEGNYWIYRADERLAKQIAKMVIPDSLGSSSDYRLNSDPFYFKFVKRRPSVGDSSRSFLISLEHLRKILSSPNAEGPRGGIRLDYDALDGTYLTESDIVGLIRSGYIGTHQAMSSYLAKIIEGVSRRKRGLVLASQKRVSESTTESNIDSLG